MFTEITISVKKENIPSIFLNITTHELDNQRTQLYILHKPTTKFY